MGLNQVNVGECVVPLGPHVTISRKVFCNYLELLHHRLKPNGSLARSSSMNCLLKAPVVLNLAFPQGNRPNGESSRGILEIASDKHCLFRYRLRRVGTSVDVS